ncbi:MAG: 30S ribosome-binding factor RbfA [Actinomycetota bacterium]|nr:30S ribosome-binding factor RbfA [Actinomycetota bacterium]
MEFSRQNRVKEALKEEISQAIVKLKDPRIEMVTVTDVDVTPDLKTAYIYISSIEEERQAELVEVLNGAKGFIKREMSKSLHLKYTPELIFKWDLSIERASRISKIIYSSSLGEEEGQ